MTGDAEAPLLGQAHAHELNDHDRHDAEVFLGEYDHGVRPLWHPERLLWQVLHAFAFLLGGTTFVAGTAALFFPGHDTLSALLYTIGSCGFLFVDVQEFFTFDGAVLRTNICMSMTGSALYVIGSVGFFPTVVAFNPRIGVWGFVLGSAFIGWSQLWKTHRIGGGEHEEGFKLSNMAAKDAATATGVELGAGLGALCFLFGTLLYDNGPLEGPGSVLGIVLWTWIAGSLLFTAGGCFLAARHFVMRTV